MVRRASWWARALVALCIGTVSCTPWETTYLEKAVNQATQAEVRQRFGPPHAITPLNSGGSEWTYQYRGSAVGPMGGFDTGDASCHEYILTFDQQDTLRHWTRQPC